MDGVPIGFICFTFATLVVFGGCGFLFGYSVGRAAGRREQQQGFPVLPAAPVMPIPPVPPVPPLPPASPASPVTAESDPRDPRP